MYIAIYDLDKYNKFSFFYLFLFFGFKSTVFAN
jgi:hypothetical protein